ncbi:Uncharacterised protein [Mycolicibacterium vanbaalenii]|uniref:Uncharacterized protein n=1 Tax=Mycolicibacterium vanbaalenii TaxID=110539 RepID=A0A5S9R4J6_MYCVN|nr:hypothetical protein [Mycolicibacterium vanbaalenii]CAA0129292.1 Uncharacterised protein [Mycolicibacterium vanbaalenii]
MSLHVRLRINSDLVEAVEITRDHDDNGTDVDAVNVGELWLSAHAEGMRNGLELAASLCNDLAGERSGISEAALENARDEIRLLALQIADPDATNVDTPGDPDA